MTWRSLLLAGTAVALFAITFHPQAQGQQNSPAPAATASAAAVPTMEIRHIHIFVTDVERTKAFYRDKLGFKVTNENPGAVVEFPGLWFGKWREQGPIPTGGITIGIGTKSVDATYAEFKKRGVTIPNPPSKPREEWSFTFKDPDGYKIEVEGPK